MRWTRVPETATFGTFSWLAKMGAAKKNPIEKNARIFLEEEKNFDQNKYSSIAVHKTEVAKQFVVI